MSSQAARLLTRLALRRNHTVHTEILDDLTVVIVAVPDHTHRESQTRGFRIAKWRGDLLEQVLLSDGVNCGVRLGELGF